MFSANTGISVSRDEGNFGGGLYFAVRSKPKLIKIRQIEIGAYINANGEISSADSLVNQPILAGVAGKFALSDTRQLSLLFTIHQLEDKIEGSRYSWEAGAGYMFRTKTELLIGLSFFYQKLDRSIAVDNNISLDVSSFWSMGATFQSASDTSPIIMIGITKFARNTDAIPAIQVSYPLSLK